MQHTSLLVLLLSCFVLSTIACRCAQRSEEEVFCASDAVLKVKIRFERRTRPTSLQRRFFAEVLDNFKFPSSGEPRYVWIVTGSSSAACGVDFEVGKEYLVPGAIVDGPTRIPVISTSTCSTNGFCTVPPNPTCESGTTCVFCTLALPRCREGCENCVITPGSCEACATATCEDDCVFCTQAIPQCEEGCANCEITPQTCDSCATATCKDCVVCTQAVPECDADCVKCAISPQTCDSCASAQCCDFLRCFPGPSSCTEGCALSGTTCCADTCVPGF